jgi:hypothetical protein
MAVCSASELTVALRIVVAKGSVRGAARGDDDEPRREPRHRSAHTQERIDVTS